jgi:hypothetical protein
MYVDGAKTMQELLQKARVTLIKMRDKAQVAQVVEQMSKILQPRPAPAQAGGPPIPGPAATGGPP